MNNKKLLIVLTLIFIVATLQVQAEKYKGAILKNTPKASSECFAPSSRTELALNHVRALLRTDGIMWFDEKAEYEVPKGSGKTSLFSAALWIGGLDPEGTLHLAAMRFRQDGNDYWNGPLQMQDASITQLTCNRYDKFFRISRVEVKRHQVAFEGDRDPSYEIPESILNWPGNGGSGESKFLAPFYDSPNSEQGKYDPENGDYPFYDFDNVLCPWTDANIQRAKLPTWLNEKGEPDPLGKIYNGSNDPFDTSKYAGALPIPLERIWTRDNYGWDNKQIFADHVLKGDETVFWFLNDKGGPHTESGGEQIGLEIRVQAFAFATNNELNKMTFYSYEIINRGSKPIMQTFFSQWIDADLGFAKDDYVGCDVVRGLGYCYNGTAIDGHGEPEAYGENPPAVGVDFFQGPYIDPDGADNPKFFKDLANINGNQNQIDYCKRFVHEIFENSIFNEEDSLLLSKFAISDFDFDGIDPDSGKPNGGPNGSKDSVRWNDQYAINGVNFGDGIVDNERFGMRRFVYHNNDHTVTGDPETAWDHYNYLRGRWKDGTPMTYGGNAYKSTTGIVCDFMFPRGTDYCNWGTKGISPGKTYGDGGRTGNWSEEHPRGTGSAANPPADRRFMQSAGPFSLKQGACNYITVGIPWARATQGGVDASIALLLVADDKCQALFENCFKVIDGPDAPNLTIREYDQKLILLLSNPAGISNNHMKVDEDYIELDNTIPEYRVDIIKNIIYENVDTTTGGKFDTVVYGEDIWDSVKYDRYFRFEGYKIYQVTGPDVGANDLDDPNLARVIRQCDIENYDKFGNPIGTLINWELDESIQLSVPKLKVTGANSGIQHSFEITQDVFATGNRQLVNYKTYYFIAIAYGYNEYWPYSVDENSDHGLQGQKEPYLRGRKTAFGASVVPISAVPHPPTPHGGASTLYSDYGTIPNIIRVDGQGNGGIALDLTPETIDKIVRGGDHNDYRVRELKYERNAGPLNIKVIDPLRVKPFEFILSIRDSLLDNSSSTTNQINSAEVSDHAYWILTVDPSVGDDELRNAGLIDANDQVMREFVSSRLIGDKYEQIILPLGLSINIQNANFVNKQPKVQQYWDTIMTKCSQSLYKAKMIYYQSEKIDVANDIVFKNSGTPWITGLADDGNEPRPSNWVRAGTNNRGTWWDTNTVDDYVKVTYYLKRQEDAFYESKEIVIPPDGVQNTTYADRAWKDFSGKFSTLCGGTWSPYVLASPYDNGPQAKYHTNESDPSNWVCEEVSGKGDRVPFYEYSFEVEALHNSDKQPGFNQTMTNLYSVDIVLTPDRDLWTRCIVLESCPDITRSEGGAYKNEPRKAKSVDKDGKPDGSKDGFGEKGDEGMGWFPGYAINIETGERLNIMFAENSDKILNALVNPATGENPVRGNDMIFNPTSTYAIATQDVYYFGIPAGTIIDKDVYDNLYDNFDMGNGTLGTEFGIERVWGGMHYVYVCNSAGNTSAMYYRIPVGGNTPLNIFLRNAKRNFNLNDTILSYPMYGTYGGFINDNPKYPEYDCGPYDRGEWLVQKFKQFLNLKFVERPREHCRRSNFKMQLYNNVMYTYIPLQPEDVDLKKAWLSCDVTYKIRVTRPYMRYISRWYESPELRNADYTVPDEFVSQKGYPVYKISTKEIAPVFNDSRLYQSVLDKINIVPNPYYGGSFYEKNALDTKVKIINLPTDLKNNAPVTINIFTVSGILVRTLTKGDNQTTYVDWDLKNYANIPVAGGVYIIHVNCPGIGERTLKFFCTMRPTDLNTF